MTLNTLPLGIMASTDRKGVQGPVSGQQGCVRPQAHPTSAPAQEPVHWALQIPAAFGLDFQLSPLYNVNNVRDFSQQTLHCSMTAYQMEL